MPQSAFHRALLCSALMLGSAGAHAGVFSISPVRVHFGPRDRAVALTITNHGTSPITLQATAYTWTQTQGGQDELTPTDDLILAPALPRVMPGTQQVVRIAFLQSRPQTEATYRIVIQELLEASPQDAGAVTAPVTVALNFPVFVTPAGAHRDLNCSSVAGGGVVCRNAGTSYALITNARVLASGQPAGEMRNPVYILAGAERSLPLESNGGQAGPAGSLTVRFEGDQSQTFDLAPRPVAR